MKLRSEPISRLSFTILDSNSSIIERNAALKEIKRRFSHNGCNYSEFIKVEEEALSKRGNDISKYLIQDKPTAQLLFETYFEYVYKDDLNTHGNLLFSEVLLCNEVGDRTKFIKYLQLELENIATRIMINTESKKDIEKLRMVSDILNERLKNVTRGYDDSITDVVLDIIPGPNSFTSEEKLLKQEKKFEKIDEEMKNGKKIIAILRCLPYVASSLILENDFMEYTHMRYIAYKELLKLRKQNASIMDSLKNGVVDYSFIDSEKLALKREKYNRIYK